MYIMYIKMSSLFLIFFAHGKNLVSCFSGCLNACARFHTPIRRPGASHNMHFVALAGILYNITFPVFRNIMLITPQTLNNSGILRLIIFITNII